MKIVFMGTPEFSAAFLRHLLTGPHEVVAVATQPDRPAGRGRGLQAPPVKEVAVQAGLPVLQPESTKDPAFAESLRALNADLFVVVAYSLLPKAVLAASRYGAVNLHGSLLPRYRGAAPVQWAIANGDAETGVTVFLLDEKMDHGPMLEQCRLPISNADTTASILDKMIPLGCTAIDAALDKIVNGYTALEQNHAESCPAPKLRKEDGLINWALSAVEIHNRIRAFTPWPGGFSYYDGRLVYLRRTEVDLEARLAPGTVRAEKDRMLVGCGEGALVVLEIQAEGKKSLPVGDFMRGWQIKHAPLFTDHAL